MRILYFLLLLWHSVVCASPHEVYPFASEQQKRQYNQILANVRCMVCQNQSLSDSNADLAVIMRERIYNMLVSGQSEREINDYLRKRYGDFIFFTPPWQKRTFFLWLTPVFLLLISLSSMFHYIRRLQLR